MGPAVEALIAALNLTATCRRDWVAPVIATKDRFSRSLGRTIAAGRSCGLSERTSVQTVEGIMIETEFISEIFGPGQEELVEWAIDGEPPLEVRFPEFPGYEATGAALVNRIPAVVAADPGYRTVVDLPAPRWWPGDEIAS